MRTILLALVLACGGSKSPPAQPDPTPPGAPLAAEPPAEDGGPAPTNVKPEDPSCPALEQYTASLGQACPVPETSCGYTRCREAKGFCNIIVCRDGVWKNVEVPPPPPPGVK